MAGFSFDSYTEIDRAQGVACSRLIPHFLVLRQCHERSLSIQVWVSAGDSTRAGLEGVQAVSPFMHSSPNNVFPWWSR